MNKNYRLTLIACYLGFVSQAIVVNFAPLLFFRFHDFYGISYGKIALIPAVFFIVQILVDVFCAAFAARIGYRICIIVSEALVGAGLVLLAVLPGCFADPFSGILVSVVIYAAGSGLIEVLISPIVEACPFDNKETVMSLLHSFYCWGAVGVIAVSSVFFFLFGIERWQILSCLLSLVPLVNIINFMKCPIEHLPGDGGRSDSPSLFSQPLFWVALLLMVCTGASEHSMSQWASAYVESALGLPKSLGDLLGPCMFAAAMGITRTLYGKFGEKLDLNRLLILSGTFALFSYLLCALSSSPAAGLVGCVLCGFSVSMLWPGTLSLFSKKIPLGGTALFAFLAVAGDIGCTIGPSLVGDVAERYGDNLREGLLAGSVFPLIFTISAIILKFNSQKRRPE